MSPVNAQTDFGDALDDTWDEKLTGFLNKVASQPYKYDYFSLLRQLESVKFVTGGKLLGKAVSPKMEKIRIRQEPSLIFAPRNIQSVALSPRYVEISINGFGLFGPSGPLPLHLTEYAYERQHQHGDRTWTGFANMLQHHNKGLIHEFAKRYFAGLLMKQSRSAANLQQLLNRYFKVPVTIQTNVGYWVEVAEEKTQIGIMGNYTLGDGLLLGDKLYDVQSKFRIIIGPLTLPAYRSFFKDGINTTRLREWVRLFAADEYEWDIQPVLMQKEVPLMDLGGQTQLGLTTWLGNVSRDAEDLIVSNH